MAFRRIYRHLLKSKKLTTVFRPRDMIKSSFRSYKPGEIVKARIIKDVGADWKNLPPRFENESIMIRITKVTAKRIGELSEEDFKGSSPDVRDKKGLICHLGLIYNLPIEKLNDDTIISRVEFEYI